MFLTEKHNETNLNANIDIKGFNINVTEKIWKTH